MVQYMQIVGNVFRHRASVQLVESHYFTDYSRLPLRSTNIQYEMSTKAIIMFSNLYLTNVYYTG